MYLRMCVCMYIERLYIRMYLFRLSWGYVDVRDFTKKKAPTPSPRQSSLPKGSSSDKVSK